MASTLVQIGETFYKLNIVGSCKFLNSCQLCIVTYTGESDCNSSANYQQVST